MTGTDLTTTTGGTGGGGLQRRDVLTREQVDIIKATIAKGATDTELAMFIEQCQHRGLSPLNGQIWGVKRREYVDGAWREVFATQVGIAGLRMVAERSGLFGGRISREWCGPDGEWRDVWLSDEPPAAARVAIRRTDHQVPTVGVVTYREYCQRGRDGNPVGRWKTAPADQLAKCAEANALRAAFPEELAGIEVSYSDDGPGPVPDQARPAEPVVSVPAQRWQDLLATGAAHGLTEDQVRAAIAAAGLPGPSVNSLADTPQGAATYDAMRGAVMQAGGVNPDTGEIIDHDDDDQGDDGRVGEDEGNTMDQATLDGVA